MKNQIGNYLILSLLILMLTSCKKDGAVTRGKIVHKTVNEEYVLIQDVEELRSSNDPISAYINSIIDAAVNTEVTISTGLHGLDIDADNQPDISFEIIDLRPLNPQGLPAYFDHLAASAKPHSIQILDNSTYGYPDALTTDDLIDANGNWREQHGVLGTFANAGQFQAKGDRYLGFRMPNGTDFKYGWIKLNCSAHNDTLKVLEYAYNDVVGIAIKAGEKETTTVAN
ncbi:MAG: hypothetical protein GY810_22830 [Aureispira sp.]|nr:hypothetical protein [Aureispira sp.]